jgi:hypothetical protein
VECYYHRSLYSNYDANGIVTPKPENEWTTYEERKWSYDWKARTILISSLGVDEYYRISNCRSVKDMWDTLEIAHEGTNDVKQSKINVLTQEFEFFRIKDGETISDMQKRFIYLTNRLHMLGKDATSIFLSRCIQFFKN